MGDVLAGAGLFAAVFAAAAAIVWAPSARRSAAMLLALALIPVLICADQWQSAEIVDLRDDAARFAALGFAAALAVAGLTFLFRHRPILVPLALVAAVPFRIPIEAGGEEANLLVPLYLVIGGGVLATIWTWWVERGAVSSAGDERAGGGPLGRTRGRALGVVLATVIVLYAIQSVYSEDFSRALQNAVFFYVPFALAFALLADCRWDRRLLSWTIAVVAAEALVFCLFGFWEYGARHLIWNPEVIQSNDFHTYFRVNSLFWDPNIYGRYLALTLTALVAVLLWIRGYRTVLWVGVLAIVLWLGLVTTFSQSSFAALLAGMAALAALRWSLRWTLFASVAAAVAAAAFVLAAAGSLKIDLSTERELNQDTGGRANLVSEGIGLFGDRPLWGYGSGSFPVAYQEHRTGGSGQLSVSHTEPVTVAAEQGLVGLAAYIALLTVAFATLLRGMRALMPGLRGPPPGDGRTALLAAARAAVLACFIALIAHTMAYAGFLEDPLTWVLLAIGGSLAFASGTELEPAVVHEETEAVVASGARAPA
ncbi:MAG: O-antigen ligase family protein [Solirubrobacterales bacterium]